MTPAESTAMWSAIAGIVSGVASAVAMHLLTRRRDAANKHLEYRLDKYAEFLGAFAAMGGARKDTYDAGLRFAEAMNTVLLLANGPTTVALVALQDHIARPGTTLDEQSRVVDTLIRAIRRELKSDDVPRNVLLTLVSPTRDGEKEPHPQNT